MLGAGADALGRPADPRARVLTCPTEDFSGRLWLGAGRHPARTKCWEPGEAGGRSLIAGGVPSLRKLKQERCSWPAAAGGSADWCSRRACAGSCSVSECPLDNAALLCSSSHAAGRVGSSPLGVQTGVEVRARGKPGAGAAGMLLNEFRFLLQNPRVRFAASMQASRS